MKYLIKVLLFVFFQSTLAQSTFTYDVVLTPVSVAGLPGLHSYAFAQHEGKWLIIGGRKDGVHARQPFRAFPGDQNNTDLYVVDVAKKQSWSASVHSLPTALKEQLQSTNMNFYQDGDQLFIIGGYAYSNSASDHKTFPHLTSVDVPNLIHAIIKGSPIQSFFKQITNDVFAITGGQLGKIGTTFYLVGGHRFDGRYNPMNHPTFTQTYSNAIRKFTINTTGTSLTFTDYEEIVDPVHLHRRDYNLLPQVFPNGELGYTISSGVFQIEAELPFLYPVDIKTSGYFPQMQFNQYLSNYHSGKVCLYDAVNNQMHNLFFGGISRYSYQNGALLKDDSVPFVKTISSTTRFADGSMAEYQLPIEMPNLKGAGAEFIPNLNLPHYSNEVLQLSKITEDSFVIGHLFGGIQSTSPDAFSTNQTHLTSADPTVYEVKLVKNTSLVNTPLDGKNPFSLSLLSSESTADIARIQFEMPYLAQVNYLVTSSTGAILEAGEIEDVKQGVNTMSFDLKSYASEVITITFIFDDTFYTSELVSRKNKK
ncbi:hypothetical protein NAT47_05165 [Flavobacterium sp. HXWNR69]|uniref:T9SS C-terminal target domain-containing protein n=1 Tax=Flavobacterium fragile TaxID=2949085 RepID=A0ABT0THB6_9FLAO|nr:hypothetical protein [Flavobacterium sp. HXWNR69]MCL9769800.1 hypothetical protein [Flavobacterium sp. HXWNR69]